MWHSELSKADKSDLKLDMKPSDFVTQQTMLFFNKMCLPIGFLEADPGTWLENTDYKTAVSIIMVQKVVNDTAERGVALMQEYNELLTRNEEDKQFVLQVVAQHRKLCLDAKKATVSSALTKM